MNTIALTPPTQDIQIVNISPTGTAPYFECAGPLVEKHFRLCDMIEKRASESDAEEDEMLCLELIGIAPTLIAAEKEAAEMNGQHFFPVAHLGYNRLSAIRFARGKWDDVLEIYDEAARAGWNVSAMEGRVAKARTSQHL